MKLKSAINFFRVENKKKCKLLLTLVFREDDQDILYYFTGNPTYERGLDNSLDLTPVTAVNHSDPSPYAVIPCDQPYQPIVENTRSDSANGGNNLYETLKSLRGSMRGSLLPRRVSYTLYQDLNGATPRPSGANHPYQNVELLSETPVTTSDSATNESDVSTPANSNVHHGCDSTPLRSKRRLRCRSEPSGSKGISLHRASTKNSNKSNFYSLDSKQRDIKLMDSKQVLLLETRALDGEKGLPVDETKVGVVTGTCHSNSSSSLQETESFVGSDFVTQSSSLSSSPQNFDAEDRGENEEASDSSVEAQQELDKLRTISSEGDTIHDSSNDRSSEYRLSDLEIVIDSDCSEYDETENQSDPFYYVLEGPNPTPTL